VGPPPYKPQAVRLYQEPVVEDKVVPVAAGQVEIKVADAPVVVETASGKIPRSFGSCFPTRRCNPCRSLSA
jgi:hypothetical protein